MRPDRLIAAAAALVVGGGIAAAATTAGHSDRPAAERDRPAARTVTAPPPASATSSRPPTPAAPTASAPHRTVAARPLYPLPAPPAWPSPCPPPPLPPGPPPPPPPKPTVKTANLPPALPVQRHHVDLHPITGKGMWLTTWPDTHLDVARVIALARHAGLRQLWVRTGGTPQGWYGTALLDRILPAAHAAGIDVIAWDFPMLSDPMADVARARAAITGTFAGQHIDGFSPDIETINEGTFNTPRRVRLYLSYVRHYAGSLPVIATVMRPTPHQLATYPYHAEAPYIDAFAPMIYWSCNEPGELVRESLAALAKLRPVHVVGQSYDMGPEGGRQGLPTGREIWRFLDVAKRDGAVGASLYVYDETRAPQWKALARYPWR